MPFASLIASSLAQKCMKISRGCSVSMWLWIAVTSLPFALRAGITGLTSEPRSTARPEGRDHRIALRGDQNVVAGEGRLAATGRLEVDRGRPAERCSGRQLKSAR